MYRLYFHDRNGNFYHSVAVDVGSDEEALHEAQMFDHVNAIEVWQGDVWIGTIPPRGSATAGSELV